MCLKNETDSTATRDADKDTMFHKQLDQKQTRTINIDIVYKY